MSNPEDKNLALIEQELRFIRRHVQGFDADFDRADEIGMSVESALRALREYELSLQPACEEVPADVPIAA
jgi:hypothetical protein